MKSSSQPPHSISLNNGTAQRQAHRKWRRQAKQFLNGPKRRGAKRKYKKEKRAKVESGGLPLAAYAPDPRKGSRSLFII